ncbi:MAG: SAM-dependent methyltransferase [Methanobacteriota archaeon]|nr:MAG: SAM-dependent methyltransferase [Euryarchaeota archaeon]
MEGLFSSYVINNYWKKGVYTTDLGYTNRKGNTEELLEAVKDFKVRGAQVYFIEDGSKVAVFCDGHYYALTMRCQVPSLDIDGLRMHLFKDWATPIEYAKSVASLMPIGTVLDTCAGLGYISIELANKGAAVSSIEISDAVLELARINPFSKDLFEKANIDRGDAYNLIENYSNLDGIVHDPPRASHAPLLYSRDFYNKCFNALKDGGLFYHYVGSKTSPKLQLESAAKRLREAGFSIVKKLGRHQAVLAKKPVEDL